MSEEVGTQSEYDVQMNQVMDAGGSFLIAMPLLLRQSSICDLIICENMVLLSNKGLKRWLSQKTKSTRCGMIGSWWMLRGLKTYLIGPIDFYRMIRAARSVPLRSKDWAGW